MYDISRYYTFFPPAAWLALLALLLLLLCHLMVRYFELRIRFATRQALKRNHTIDPNYVAHQERRYRQQWQDGRELSFSVLIFGLTGWLISL